MYDPVLAVWRRRRGRDTFVSSRETTTNTSPELQTAVEALVKLGSVQLGRMDKMDARVEALEKIIADIGKLKR